MYMRWVWQRCPIYFHRTHTHRVWMQQPQEKRISIYFSLIIHSFSSFSYFRFLSTESQILDQRIDIFINTAENICNSNSEIKPFVQNSIGELKKYWNEFKRQVTNTRQNIEDTKTYFNINDQVSVCCSVPILSCAHFAKIDFPLIQTSGERF